MKRNLLFIFIAVFGFLNNALYSQSVTGVTLTPNTVTINVYESYQLNAEVIPADAANKNVTWSSSRPNIVEVNNTGEIFGNNGGYAWIYVTTEDGGFQDSCYVTCIDPYGCEFNSFSFDNEVMPAFIYDNYPNGIVKGFLPTGTDLSNLTVASYEITPGATITPLPETITDFSDTVTFTITSQNGNNTKIWEVVVDTFPDFGNAQMVTLIRTTPYDYVDDTVSWSDGLFSYKIDFPDPSDTTWPPSAMVDTGSIALFPATFRFYLLDPTKVIVGARITIQENCGTSCTPIYFQGDSSNYFTYIPPMTTDVYTFDLKNIEATQGYFGSYESSFDNIKVWIANKEGYVNNPPVADAGPDQTVIEGDTAFFDGTGSFDPDGDPITYHWLAPGGINLINPNSATPYFVTPNVDQNTTFSFVLYVNDGVVNSAFDTVYVTVLNQNMPPTAVIEGDTIDVLEGDSTFLSGQFSFDPDNDPLNYHWWTDPGNGVVLTDTTSMYAKCFAPLVSHDTTFAVYLQVDDGILLSNIDTLILSVININHPPIADAGTDTTVFEGDTLVLNGTASYDPDGDPLSYHWLAPGGITLLDPNSPMPLFVTPDVTENTTFTFALYVNDGEFNSSYDTVQITVLKVNQPPVAWLDFDTTYVYEGDSTLIFGYYSYDPDGDPINYHWWTDPGSELTFDDTTAPEIMCYAPIVYQDTVYPVYLQVDDGDLLSNIDTTFVVVMNINQVPVADAGIDTTVYEGDTLALDGTASYDPDGDPITYFWIAPAGVTLLNPNSATPLFVTPDVTQNTTYTFTLFVNDGEYNSDYDTVLVTVLKVNQPPVAWVDYDTAYVFEGDSTYIYGYYSYDPDGDPLNYHWWTDPGSELTFNDTTASELLCYAPYIYQDTVFPVYLQVDDGELMSNIDTTYLKVMNINQPPVAYAGIDTTVYEGDTVALDGTDSFDPDGDNISYHWIAPAGLTLLNPTSATPLFVTPDVTENTTYTFTLYVNDGEYDSNYDTVLVTVLKVNQPPVAWIDFDSAYVNEGDSTVIYGYYSYDPDGDPLNYHWWTDPGSELTFNDTTASELLCYAPYVLNDTVFPVYLQVDDGELMSNIDTTYLIVKDLNQMPIADAGEPFEILSGLTATLDGTASYDPNGDALSYQWFAPANVTLNNAQTATPSFQAPFDTLEQILTFKLVVNDGVLYSDTAYVDVLVLPAEALCNITAKLNGNIINNDLHKTIFYYQENGEKWVREDVEYFDYEGTRYYALWEGNWLATANPISASQNFVSTFYGDVAKWTEAEVFSIETHTSTELTINCLPAPTNFFTGLGLISGFIYRDQSGLLGPANTITHVDEPLTKGDPEEEALIYLYKWGENTPIASRLTNDEGLYVFDLLPVGDYYLSIQFPGFESNEIWDIEITEDQYTYENVNFVLNDSNGVILNINDRNQLNASVFPNPVINNYLHVVVNNKSQKSMYTLYDLTGNKLMEGEFYERTKIKTDKLNHGLYLLRIINNNRSRTFKVIKQ